MITEGAVALPATYRFEERGTRPVIVCLVCGSVSYHPMDLNQRYCACCAIFHGDRAQWAAAAGWQQFLLGVEPLPAGVVVVWVDSAPALAGSATEKVRWVHPEEPPQGGKLDFAVKTPVGWQVARHGDWIVTLLSGEQVINRGGVWLGLE